MRSTVVSSTPVDHANHRYGERKQKDDNLRYDNKPHLTPHPLRTKSDSGSKASAANPISISRQPDR